MSAFLRIEIFQEKQTCFNVVSLVGSIYPPDSWDNVIDVKHRAIVTQTHFWS